jgi:hypothetical protein
MLDRTRGVACHGEIFCPDAVYGLSRSCDPALRAQLTVAIRDRDPLAFLRELGFRKGSLAGFKILYQDLLAPSSAALLDFLRNDRSIRIVMLWRRDLVQRYISQEIHGARAGHHARREEPGWSDGLRILVSPDDFVATTNWLIETRSLLAEAFADHRQLALDYEDFVSSAEARARILDFLGVDPQVRGDFLVPERRVSHPHADIEVTIANLAEAEAEMRRRSSELRTIMAAP